MAANSLPCAFCGTPNDPAAAACFACGGPLEVARPVAPVITQPSAPVLPVTPVTQPAAPETPVEPLREQIKEGVAAVGAGLGLAGVGGLLFRTLAEALAIILAAMMVGFNAGRVSPFKETWFLFLLLGAGGGTLVGLAVGSVVKRSIFALFSAPFGALLGIVAALGFKLTAVRTPWLPLFTLAGACLFALLGGRSNRTARFAKYQRLRPLLGAIGGTLFGLLGFGIGWIVH
jgi:hypothetical protein